MKAAGRLIVVAVLAAAAPALWFGATAAADNPSARPSSDAASTAKRGPRGPRGPRGRRGPQGPAGIATVTAVDGPVAAQCPGGGGACQVAGSEAVCPAGSTVVGGGYETATPDNMVAFARRVTPTSYGVVAVNYWPAPSSIKAQAICASGPGLSGTFAAASRVGITATLKLLRDQLD